MREVKWLKPVPWIVLFLLFLAGSSLWLLFVHEQQLHLRVGFRAQLERLGDELLRSRLEGRLSDDTLPTAVRSFAIYDQKGDRLAAWGSEAPDHLDVPRDDLGGFPIKLARNGDGTTDLIKALVPLHPRMNLWSDGDQDDSWGPPDPRPRGGRFQGFFLLRVIDGSLENRQWGWSVGGVLGSATWGGFLIFVGYLWYRTRRYQQTLLEHRELLQFAEASRTLSHELQTPLAAILLQTALLKRSAGGSPPPEVTIIAEEAQRMSALVNRVRDFLKDPRGQVEVLDMAEFEASVKGRFPDDAPWRKSPDGKFPVLFDAHRLRSVIENLIKNAWESGPTPQPEIRLSKPRPGWIRFEVLDSGMGFSAQSLRRAGAPLFTTKSSGTGMGLSIAGSFVSAAGGKLRFENRPEGGARVWFDVPEAARNQP